MATLLRTKKAGPNHKVQYLSRKHDIEGTLTVLPWRPRPHAKCKHCGINNKDTAKYPSCRPHWLDLPKDLPEDLVFAIRRTLEDGCEPTS